MKSDPKLDLKAQILAALRKAETSWSGFVDVQALALELAVLVEDHKRELFRAKPVIAPEKEEPTEAFENAFSDHLGTSFAVCELCGRTLFTSDLKFDRAGEWDDLVAKREQDPEKYILVDYSSLSIGSIAGRRVVIGCPCNGLRRYENFIWGSRRQIAEYMAKRLEDHEKALAEYKEQAKAVKKAAKIDS